MSDGLSIILLGQAVDNLKAEVSRLTAALASCQGLLDNSTAELATRTQERDAARKERNDYLTVLGQVDDQLPNPGGDPANGVKRLIKERDGLAAGGSQ